MNKVAVITGAGSGVGRAKAVKLAQSGWTVVLIGRTEATLKATADLTKKPEGCMIAPLRIGDLEGTNQIAAEVLKRFGRIDLVVNAAGTNVPKRSLEV